MLSCLMKLANFLCLKYLGSKFLVKRLVFFISNESPESVQLITWLFLESLIIEYTFKRNLLGFFCLLSKFW